MGFWNSLFGKKEVKVELPKEEEKELLPSVDKEINERLDSIDLDIESLALDKIRSEAEAISSYLKGLMQDINKYSNLMDKKEMQKQIIKSITGKIKVITQHSLELKNLIAHVEQRYHDYLLENKYPESGQKGYTAPEDFMITRHLNYWSKEMIVENSKDVKMNNDLTDGRTAKTRKEKAGKRIPYICSCLFISLLWCQLVNKNSKKR